MCELSGLHFQCSRFQVETVSLGSTKSYINMKEGNSYHELSRGTFDKSATKQSAAQPRSN